MWNDSIVGLGVSAWTELHELHGPLRYRRGVHPDVAGWDEFSADTGFPHPHPARRFGYSDRTGRIAVGWEANLVVLQADPAKHVTALSKVQLTTRDGKIG